MVGSAEPINGFLCLKTTKMYVSLHEPVGSTDPTDGILDPATQETCVLFHETAGFEDSIAKLLCEHVCFMCVFKPYLDSIPSVVAPNCYW